MPACGATDGVTASGGDRILIAPAGVYVHRGRFALFFMAAISYSVDKALGVIFEVWSGDITAADLQRYWQSYLADPDARAVRKSVVDLRHANIRFTGSELARLVETVVIPSLNGLQWKTAIVVATPVQFGVSRQYEVFAEQYSTDHIFRDFDEALRWIRG
jgi:hypothetical protein